MTSDKETAASDSAPLPPATVTTLEEATPKRRLRPSPAYVILGVLLLAASAVLLYLYIARAVTFSPEPFDTTIEVSGRGFKIGENYLLLPGNHRVTGVAKGYFPFDQTIVVGDEDTQEIEITLEPMPGQIEIRSPQDGISVFLDDRLAGSAPGMIENVSRGQHKFRFEKSRYFPFETDYDVDGLGLTQALEVVLEPAWGQLRFNTLPSGAELYIDDKLIGQTPLTTEVLETGSLLRLTAPGFVPVEKTVSVKAGTTEVHPTVELQVADGILHIASNPAGASVSINQQFSGVAPMSMPLSPLNEHVVELSLEGYRKSSHRVRVDADEDISMTIDLDPIIGHIKLTVTPSDAEIVVDGQSQGSGSQTLALPAREHTIVIRKPGFEAQTLKLTPRPELEQTMGIRLMTMQEAYRASRPTRSTSPAGSELKLFRPADTFTLGAPLGEPGRRPNEVERKVRLERPFYIGIHEVTNGEFRQWKQEHRSGAVHGSTLNKDRQPVVDVSWQEAALYCNWLSQRQGLPLFYIEENGHVTGFDANAHGYRLPTEAEWAWAAKIGSGDKPLMYPWDGEDYPPLEAVENYADLSAANSLDFTLTTYDDGHLVSAPVGSFWQNRKGLFDLGGNVSEWVHDYYDIQPGNGEPALDPTGPVTGHQHVVRGANWSLALRSALRLGFREAGNEGRLDTGFRIARYAEKKSAQDSEEN